MLGVVLHVVFYLENLFPFSTVIYRSFGETMSDLKAWMVIALTLWQAVALDKVIHRYAEWQQIKREKLSAIDEIENK